jgi:hypothetical protein
MTIPSSHAASNSFGNGWPADCPPKDAVDADGLVHRIVKSNPPDEEDLKSHAELGTALNAPECGRRGVSVYSTRKHACHRLKLSPRLGTMVAEATLCASHGKMMVTSPKSGHIEWWPYEGVARHLLFQGASPCP